MLEPSAKKQTFLSFEIFLAHAEKTSNKHDRFQGQEGKYCFGDFSNAHRGIHVEYTPLPSPSFFPRISIPKKLFIKTGKFYRIRAFPFICHIIVHFCIYEKISWNINMENKCK